MLAVVDLLVLICAITLPLLYFAHQNLSRRISADHSPPVSKHERTDQQRQAGEWQSTVFDYPPVTPCNDTLENIPPRAYRPFKEGTYHVTMGIRNLDFNEWIELDSEFLNYHHIRAARIAERGSKLVQVLPDRSVVRGAGPAAEELVQELCEFLSRRYPSVYQVTRDSSSRGWYGSGEVTEIKILLTGEHFDLRVDEPMKVAAMLIPDDLAILIEGNDGKYYLQGGAIVVPGTWRLDDKIGMPLDEIHITGEVPYYQERLQPSMTRFFTKLQIARPVVRNNWFFQSVEPRDERDPEELAWYTSILGHEDHFSHPLSSYKREIGAEPSPADTSARVNATAAPPSIDRLRLRSERQTLRRLPRSGAIVFTVRTYKTPIATLVKEPGMAQRLARALRAVKASAPEVYSRMLSKDGLEKLLLEYLDVQC